MKRSFKMDEKDFVNYVTSDDLVGTSEMCITKGDDFITVDATATVHAAILSELLNHFDDEELEAICM